VLVYLFYDAHTLGGIVLEALKMEDENGRKRLKKLLLIRLAVLHSLWLRYVDE
jgi:hypothetical protein